MLGDKDQYSVKDLVSELGKRKMMPSDEKIALGMTILVEGILFGHVVSKKIPRERLKQALNFDEYCRHPWGRISFDFLVDNILKITPATLEKNVYNFQGFAIALHLWALSAMPNLGKSFATRKDGAPSSPLCLQWASTRAPKLNDVFRVERSFNAEVITIIGDSAEHENLVSGLAGDREFEKVVKLVLKGYRLKREDWENKYLDIIAVADFAPRASHPMRQEIPTRSTTQNTESP